MIAKTIILQLFVCLIAMLFGRLVDRSRGQSAATSRPGLPVARGIDQVDGGNDVIHRTDDSQSIGPERQRRCGGRRRPRLPDRGGPRRHPGSRPRGRSIPAARQAAAPLGAPVRHRPGRGRGPLGGVFPTASRLCGRCSRRSQTDDAFVAGHITYVSPRVEGLVTEVLVDQDDRVEPGQLLVKLDREPFEVAVAQAEASLEEARANVVQARAQVRSQIAQARGAYYQRKNAQETLRRQIATSERPVRHPQEQAGDPGAGAEQPQAGRGARCRAEASARKSSTSGTTP